MGMFIPHHTAGMFRPWMVAAVRGLFLFSCFVCLPPFRQGGEVLFFLSVPCRCPAISAFYQKKKGKDFQDITAQKLPLTARNTPRRSIVAIWTRRHWRAGRARQEEKTQPPLASPLPSPVPRDENFNPTGCFFFDTSMPYRWTEHR